MECKNTRSEKYQWFERFVAISNYRYAFFQRC